MGVLRGKYKKCLKTCPTERKSTILVYSLGYITPNSYWIVSPIPGKCLDKNFPVTSIRLTDFRKICCLLLEARYKPNSSQSVYLSSCVVVLVWPSPHKSPELIPSGLVFAHHVRSVSVLVPVCK